jgi:azurin
MKQLKSTLLAATLTLTPAVLFAEAAAGTTEKNEEKRADIEITVTCNDTMQFDKKTIEIPAGKIVKLTLKNIGKVPKIAMGHNLIVLDKGTDLTAWAMKAMTAKDTDFIPADDVSKKAVLAHTKLLGPDEEDAITFTIKEAGDYEFLCSFPGHFALMKGKITVK